MSANTSSRRAVACEVPSDRELVVVDDEMPDAVRHTVLVADDACAADVLRRREADPVLRTELVSAP